LVAATAGFAASIFGNFEKVADCERVEGWDSAAHAVPVVASNASRSIPKSCSNEEAILRMAAGNGAKEEPSAYNLSSFRSQNGNSGSISRPAKIIMVGANQSCRTEGDFDPQFGKECK